MRSLETCRGTWPWQGPTVSYSSILTQSAQRLRLFLSCTSLAPCVGRIIVWVQPDCCFGEQEFRRFARSVGLSK